MGKKESPGYRLLLIRMKKRRSQIIFLLALIVLEIVFSVSNLGFIHAGRLSITILHIPVILAAVMLGLPEGLMLACVFGLMSIYSACGGDPGSIDYLFRDPRIALIPRLLIPITAWAGYKAACSIADDHTLSARLINACASAVCGSLANTVFVVLSLNLFYPSVFGMDETITARAVIASDLISINVLCEIFASAAAVALAVLISHLTGIRRESCPEASPAPIRKTFQKWWAFT